MSPEEQQDIGGFAGQQATNGAQAEAFSRYIGGHLAAVNDGATYAETQFGELGKRDWIPTPPPSSRARPTPCSRVRRFAGSC